MDKDAGNVVPIKNARRSCAVKPEGLETIMNAMQDAATCHVSLMDGLVSRLTKNIDMDFFDRNGFRGFLIDVVNCIASDEEIIQEWLKDKLDSWEEWSGYNESLFCTQRGTDQQVLSEAAYRVVTDTSRSDVIGFAASIYWLTSGKYCYEKIPSVEDILKSAVWANYDSAGKRALVDEISTDNLPAWFVRRMIDDVWYFSAIMANGDFIIFNSIDSVFEQDGLHAIIDQDSIGGDPYLTRPINEYERQVISKNRMEIFVKNIKEVRGVDGSLWLDAEIAEKSAYERYRTKISINKKYIMACIDAADGWSLVRFSIRSLRLKKEKQDIIDLNEAVMFFEISDT